MLYIYDIMNMEEVSTVKFCLHSRTQVTTRARIIINME